MSPFLDNSASWFDASGSLLIDAPDAGWTFLSLVTGQVGQSAWIFSLLLLGTSSILGQFSRHHLKDANRYGGVKCLVLLVDARNLRTGTGYDAGTGRYADSAGFDLLAGTSF